MPGALERASSGIRRNAFWIVGVGLVIYVAFCTGQRDNHWRTDAWEHHRAIVALVDDLWEPSNPTYATAEPSIRYSPYTIALALLSRATGADPYHLLSGAAAANTALLVVALWWFLRRYGEAPVGVYALIIMVSLYGTAPGYANSYALSDLPWHQVNPSAFAFALSLLAFERVEYLLGRKRPWLCAGLVAIITAVILLSHAMTGVFCGIGFGAIALVRQRTDRLRALCWVAGIALAAGIICVWWPWYDFVDAVASQRKHDMWFNRGITVLILTNWCLPAALAALSALPYRHDRLVKLCLVGGTLCFATGILALVVRSPSFARVPLPGVVFFHLAVAVFASRVRLLSPSSWPARFKNLSSVERRTALPAVVEVVIAFAVVFLLWPQLLAVAAEPHLARAYIAPITGRENKQLDLKERFDDLLEPIGSNEVVLSDLITSWPIPSSGGRIVAALHLEFYSPDQEQRRQDVKNFFSPDDSINRLEIIERYNVRWIVLNKSRLGKDLFEALLDSEAVVRENRDWVLMEALRWKVSHDGVQEERSHNGDF